MTKKDLENHKAGLLIQRQQAIDAINARFEKKLDAIRVLMDEESPEPLDLPGLPTKNFKPTADKSFASTLMDAIMEAIRETSGIMGGMAGKFSSETLLTYIQSKYPNLAETPSNLSGSLWRLKKDGLIEVVTQGTGRNPSIYQKTKLFDATK